MGGGSAGEGGGGLRTGAGDPREPEELEELEELEKTRGGGACASAEASARAAQGDGADPRASSRRPGAGSCRCGRSRSSVVFVVFAAAVASVGVASLLAVVGSRGVTRSFTSSATARVTFPVRISGPRTELRATVAETWRAPRPFPPAVACPWRPMMRDVVAKVRSPLASWIATSRSVPCPSIQACPTPCSANAAAIASRMSSPGSNAKRSASRIRHRVTCILDTLRRFFGRVDAPER